MARPPVALARETGRALRVEASASSRSRGTGRPQFLDTGADAEVTLGGIPEIVQEHLRATGDGGRTIARVHGVRLSRRNGPGVGPFARPIRRDGRRRNPRDPRHARAGELVRPGRRRARDRGRPGADPARVAEITRNALDEGAIGLDEEAVRALERRIGVPLSAELHAFLLAAGATTGWFEVLRGESDWADYGDDRPTPEEKIEDDLHAFELSMELLGPGAPDALLARVGWEDTWWGPERERDDTGRVRQPSDAVRWFPIGRSGDGERVLVDLTPGPNGHLGQVLWTRRMHPEPELVAESFTAFLTETDGGVSAHWVEDPVRSVRIDAELLADAPRLADRLAHARTIRVDRSVPVFSASLLAGCPHLERLLMSSDNHLTDVSALTVLPRLRAVSMPLAAARELLDGGVLPPSLGVVQLTEHRAPLELVAPVLDGLRVLGGVPAAWTQRASWQE